MPRKTPEAKLTRIKEAQAKLKAAEKLTISAIRKEEKRLHDRKAYVLGSILLLAENEAMMLDLADKHLTDNARRAWFGLPAKP